MKLTSKLNHQRLILTNCCRQRKSLYFLTLWGPSVNWIRAYKDCSVPDKKTMSRERHYIMIPGSLSQTFRNALQNQYTLIYKSRTAQNLVNKETVILPCTKTLLGDQPRQRRVVSKTIFQPLVM